MAAIATSAVVVHPPSPSPFASLLRRSKFASYDPTIGQVYTTYDGNAYRGNWGFKRPLALRKRNKFISVKAVDSPEQQTEWSPRESEARFIKRWEEVATEPSIRDAWETHCTSSRPVHHAELAKEDQNGNIVNPAMQRQLDESPNKQYVTPGPLVSSMPTRLFTRYLDKLRRQHTIYESPNSRAIEQRPHRSGGLSYVHTSQLTQFFTTTEQPGRLVDAHSADRRRNTHASFAGMAVNGRPPVYDFEGGPKLRIVETVLKQTPNVVSAQPQGLDGATIDTTAVDVANLQMTRANSFPPGSRAYIAHAQTITPVIGKRGLTAPRSRGQPQADRETREVSKELLSTLRNIIHGFPPKGDQNEAS